MKPLLLVLLLALPASAAERLAVRVLEGGGPGAPEAQRVLETGAELARELTALTVNPVTAVARRCEDEACLRSLLTEAQAEHGLFLRATAPRRGAWEVEVAWLEASQGRVNRRRVPGTTAADLKATLRPVVAGLVPPFVRKGWGGLVVDSEAARVRVDGRVVELSGGVTPVLAGAHEVDLLLPSGEALLSRELVPEGARLRLTLPEESSPRMPGTTKRGKGLRTASYVTFSLGALAIAGSLVAGGLSRGARDGIRPCGPAAEPSCTPYSEARGAYDKSDRYARTGNVLLGAGAGLSTVGVGLFVFDLASSD
ncbi:MAG TPA: hypothetical protein VF815_06810 [Myxococcaceae bacterium]